MSLPLRRPLALRTTRSIILALPAILACGGSGGSPSPLDAGTDALTGKHDAGAPRADAGPPRRDAAEPKDAGHPDAAIPDANIPDNGQMGPGFDGGPEIEPTWTGSEAGVAVVDASGNLLFIVHTNPDGQTGHDIYTLERRTSVATVDTTFGMQGSVSITGVPDELAVTPNGTILLLTHDSTYTMILTAFDTTGALAVGFDATAAVTSMGLAYSGQDPWFLDPYDSGPSKQSFLSVQPDNEILVFGSNAAFTSGLLVRLGSSGNLDTTFGTAGVLTIAGSAATDVRLLPSGDLVVVTESSTSDGFLAIWYGPTGTSLGANVMIGENSYQGLLVRSDGSALLGTGSGDTVTYALYSPSGSLDTTAPTFTATFGDHRFIGSSDALFDVPAIGPSITVHATLPSGSMETVVTAMYEPPMGSSVLFLNALADGVGGVFLLGETCGAVNTSTETILCAPAIAQLSSSGVLQQ
jgi:hypothetical protein